MHHSNKNIHSEIFGPYTFNMLRVQIFLLHVLIFCRGVLLSSVDSRYQHDKYAWLWITSVVLITNALINIESVKAIYYLVSIICNQIWLRLTINHIHHDMCCLFRWFYGSSTMICCAVCPDGFMVLLLSKMKHLNLHFTACWVQKIPSFF